MEILASPELRERIPTEDFSTLKPMFFALLLHLMYSGQEGKDGKDTNSVVNTAERSAGTTTSHRIPDRRCPLQLS